MPLLTHTESAQLQQILMNRTLLKTADAETFNNLLVNCGLSEIGGTIPSQTSAVNRVINLVSKLSNTYVTTGTSKRLGLAIFLEYLAIIDPNLTSEDKEALAHIIRKCEHAQQVKEPSVENIGVQEPIEPDRFL